MSKLILSAFSDEYATSFAEQLAGMRHFGIRHIELRHANGKNVADLTIDEAKQLKQQLDHAGISVSAIGSPLGKIRLDGDLQAHFARARHTFALAKLFGAKYVRIFSFYAPEGQDIGNLRGRVLEGLGEMLRIAQDYAVTLCHENEAGIYGDTPARCRELLDHFQGKLRCVFDMGNFVLEGVDPLSAYKLLQGDIAYFHIKDALREGAVVPPGKGDACIGEILSSHMEYTDTPFFVSLEPHLQTFSGFNALVGRSFENPYQYPDAETAFSDAVTKFRELMKI